MDKGTEFLGNARETRAVLKSCIFQQPRPHYKWATGEHFCAPPDPYAPVLGGHKHTAAWQF